MSINIKNATQTTNQITYNYYTVNLISDPANIAANVAKITDSNKANYIKITNYPYNRAFHFQHDILDKMTNYIVSEIRICSPVHKINGNSFDGEIIIEHTEPNTGDLTYVCILLNSAENTGNNTDLDTLIQSIGDGEDSVRANCPAKMTLNNLIPKQTACFYYKSGSTSIFSNKVSGKNVYVVVFGTPITISRASADTIRANLTYIANVDIVNSTAVAGDASAYSKIVNINDPGSMTSDIYIDCDEGGVNGGDVTNKEDNSYRLSEKNVKSLFIFFSVIFVFILGFFILDKLYEEYHSNILRGLFQGIGKALYYDIGQSGVTFGIAFIICLFFVIFILFLRAVVTKNVKFFVATIYLTAILFFFVYILRLQSVVTLRTQ
jgi:hypothetical protein